MPSCHYALHGPVMRKQAFIDIIPLGNRIFPLHILNHTADFVSLQRIALDVERDLPALHSLQSLSRRVK